MPPGMYQRSTQSSIFHQGLGLILSPGRNQFMQQHESPKFGEKWLESTSTIHVPRKSVTTNGHGTEQPSLSTSHCTTRKNRKKKQRKEQTAGSQFHLVALWHSFAWIYDFGRFSAFDFPDFTKKGDQGTFTGTTIEWTFCANTSIVKVFGLLQHSHGIFIPGITAERWWHQFSCLWLQVPMWILSLCKSQIRYRTLYVLCDPQQRLICWCLFLYRFNQEDQLQKIQQQNLVTSNRRWRVRPSFPPSHLVVATAYRIIELGQGHIILGAKWKWKGGTAPPRMLVESEG